MLPADGSSTGVRAPIMQPGIRYMISPSNCEIRRGKTTASHCPKTLNQYPRPHRDYAGRRTNLSKKLAGNLVSESRSVARSPNKREEDLALRNALPQKAASI